MRSCTCFSKVIADNYKFFFILLHFDYFYICDDCDHLIDAVVSTSRHNPFNVIRQLDLASFSKENLVRTTLFGNHLLNK